MDRDTFLADERAVPPVIGVILMVAIVVVLAALVTSYIFGLGIFGIEAVPQASFDFEDNASVTDSTFNGDGCVDGSFDSNNVELEITHNGGESIPADQLTIVGAQPGSKKFHECSSVGEDEEVQNQDAAYIEAAEDDVVRVVWESKDGETSKTVAEWDGSQET